MLDCLETGGFALLPAAGGEATPDWGSEQWGVGLLLLREDKDICFSPLLLLQRRIHELAAVEAAAAAAGSAALPRRVSRQQQQQLQLLQQLRLLQHRLQQQQQQQQQQHFRLKPQAALRQRILSDLLGWKIICLNADKVNPKP